MVKIITDNTTPSIDIDVDTPTPASVSVNTGTIKTSSIGTEPLYGPKGDKGDKGDKGEQGEQGPQGPQGIQGEQGPQGIQGEKGDKGDTGPQGEQGPKGDTGPQGIQGIQGPQGIQGEKGNTGDAFAIYKTYSSISSMNADKNNVPEGKFVLIASTVEDEDNAKLFVKGASDFSFLTDMSGATGLKGDRGPQGIQGIQGEQGIQGVQGIQGEKGEKGETGATGQDGFSPTLTITKQGTVTTVTATDKNGTTSSQILDGSGSLSDVKVNNTSVVTGDTANITISQAGLSGNYNDLSNKPTIPTVPTNVSAFTNDSGYITLSDVPTEVFIATYNTTPFNDIKTAYDSGKTVLCKHSMLVYNLFYLYSNKAVFSILSDLSNSNGIVCGILQCSLSGGVTTWTDFTNRLAKYSDIPSVPTVNNATLTIQKNGVDVQTFTANSSSNKTANITVPTDTNDLTNGAGFITGITSSDVTTALGYTPCQADLSNCTKPYVTEFFTRSSSWCRVWSDGFTEQGGKIIPTADANALKISLLKPLFFVDNLTTTAEYNNSAGYTASTSNCTYRVATVFACTTAKPYDSNSDGFIDEFVINRVGTDWHINWYACGYIIL